MFVKQYGRVRQGIGCRIIYHVKSVEKTGFRVICCLTTSGKPETCITDGFMALLLKLTCILLYCKNDKFRGKMIIQTRNISFISALLIGFSWFALASVVAAPLSSPVIDSAISTLNMRFVQMAGQENQGKSSWFMADSSGNSGNNSSGNFIGSNNNTGNLNDTSNNNSPNVNRFFDLPFNENPNNGNNSSGSNGSASDSFSDEFERANNKKNRSRRSPKFYGNNDPVANNGFKQTTVKSWSAAWLAYCSRRYRSFNSHTGYFTAYSGRKIFCRVNTRNAVKSRSQSTPANRQNNRQNCVRSSSGKCVANR